LDFSSTNTCFQLKKHQRPSSTASTSPPTSSNLPTASDFTQSVPSGPRSSLSASLNLPFKNYESFDRINTWTEVLSTLDSYAASMIASINQKETKSINSAYTQLSSFIAYISALTGIPPGTSPSSATNTEVARAYRHTITSLSKLGLSTDIIKDKGLSTFSIKSRSPSVVSGSSLGSLSNSPRFTPERKFSIASEISENGELDSLKLGIKETNAVVTKAKNFIKVFRQAVNLTDENSLDSLKSDNPLLAPPSDDVSEITLTYPVKQFRAGMWTTVNVNKSGDYKEPSSLSPTATDNALANPVAANVNNRKSLFPLESFDSVIPLDAEAVKVLDHQRNMVVTILRQIFSCLDLKAPKENHINASQFMEDRRQLILSSLTSLVSLVSNMSNLVESFDLSVFQSNRRKSSATLFSTPTTNSTSLPPLFLLCDFLEAKQALYDDIIAIVSAVQKSDINDQGFMEVLAASLASTKISTSKVVAEGTAETFDDDHTITFESYENVIKRCALELGVTIDSLVQFATALAEEYTAILSFKNGVNFATIDDSSETASSSSASLAKTRMTRTHSMSSLAHSAVSVPVSTKDVPWYLEPDYDNEIVYDKKDHLRGGTLRALVERLTYHNSMNATFNTAMLLTFRSFTTPEELFQELVKRFGIQPPEGLSQEEFVKWTDQKQKLVRLRVVNIMKKWLEEYWYEDCSAKSIQTLLMSMLAFAEQLQAQNNPGHDKIMKLVEAKLNQDNSSRRRMVQNSSVPPPIPILPRNLKRMKIFDVDPLELSRQLTLREFKLFERITPFECLTRRIRKAKIKNLSIENTSYIDAFIQNSNGLTNWVSYMILKYTEAKKRAQAIKYFVNVAEYCRQCNNFSSMMAIISALYSATIHRMKKTWAAVTPRTLEMLDSMNKLMNSTRNFNEYRDILRMVTPPVIPFFGVYLSDLTFVEDGNPDFLEDNPKLINFAKRMKSADIIRDIMQYQITHYMFQEVPAIQALLDTGFSKAPPVDAQYDLSLALEPRERTNERMARLLEETGYL
jgi:hypothetical protein